IIQWAAKDLLTWHKKKFGETDLDGAFMAFAATNSSIGNKQVLDACNRKGILVNAADAPFSCDFFVPSVVRKKSLTLAISTEGKSPLFARKLREELEQFLTDAHGEFLELLGKARETLQHAIPHSSRRKMILKALVYSDILSLLKAGKRKEAQERIEQCILSLQG
ncbi:MAG: bifunctional precorrin-2 dehydrogenase/sirohydrochlorin ferrochelatase, partial [Pseudomonadota bacterium]